MGTCGSASGMVNVESRRDKTWMQEPRQFVKYFNPAATNTSCLSFNVTTSGENGIGAGFGMTFGT